MGCWSRIPTSLSFDSTRCPTTRSRATKRPSSTRLKRTSELFHPYERHSRPGALSEYPMRLFSVSATATHLRGYCTWTTCCNHVMDRFRGIQPKGRFFVLHCVSLKTIQYSFS